MHAAADEICLSETKNGRCLFIKAEDNTWGVSIATSADNAVCQPYPVEIILFTDSLNVERKYFAYEQVSKIADETVEAVANISADGCLLKVCDTWKTADQEDAVDMVRNIIVEGSSDRVSFGSSVSFPVSSSGFDDARYIVPGISYGTRIGLPPQSFFEDSTIKEIAIREDRCPVPLIGAYLNDGSWVALLNAAPDGNTSFKDASTAANMSLCSAEFAFGSIAAGERNGHANIGYVEE
jgi:hypothetical protein